MHAGVMLSDHTINSALCNQGLKPFVHAELCFQPLAHTNGRLQYLYALIQGDRIAMFPGGGRDNTRPGKIFGAGRYTVRDVGCWIPRDSKPLQAHGD